MGYRHLTGLKHDAVIDIKIRKELRDFNALTKPGEGIEEERRASENAESLAKVQKEIEGIVRHQVIGSAVLSSISSYTKIFVSRSKKISIMICHL